MHDVVDVAMGFVVLAGVVCLTAIFVSLASLVAWGCYNMITGKWIN